MSSTLVSTDRRCNLIRLERTNMVTKMEDRIKIDLIALSNLILDQLQLCDPHVLPDSREMLDRLAVQFNQGALLQYQYGEIEKAEVLCRAEIELFAQLSCYSPHRAVCLANMIAPHINLARIYGQKGEVRESLSILDDVYQFAVQQQDLPISKYCISISDSAAMFEVSPPLRKVMLSCRIVETARVLQTVEDYPALLELTETSAGLAEFDDAFFKQYILEVRSRALLQMEQYEQALETFEDCCNLMPMNTTDRVVAHLLLSQIYREWGREDSAVATLNKLEEHLRALEKYGRRLPILRQIAYRLALERHLMGDNSGALEPAEMAFRWCNELNDQPGCIKTCVLLLRISSAARRRWYEELRQLAATTLFRMERASAYWELGMSCQTLGAESVGEFLQHSYNLYRSLPFVDSKHSCELIKPSLDTWLLRFGRKQIRETPNSDSSAIDRVFEALLEYVPKSFVASQ